MAVEIVDMDMKNIDGYVGLFISAFNSEPWNDSWTEETALPRIESAMSAKTFVGKALYSENELKGFIYGQKEYYYDGIHFQIQEFCVKNGEQKKGYGNALLKALRDELDALGVVNVYLITSRGDMTEGYYRRRGFVTSDKMILMTDNKR